MLEMLSPGHNMTVLFMNSQQLQLPGQDQQKNQSSQNTDKID